MGSRGRPNGGKGAKQTPLGTLSHAVEGDEASVSAGPTGPPEVGKSKGRPGRRRRRQGPRGRGPREKDRPSWGRGSAVGQGSSICWRMGRQRPVSLSAKPPAWPAHGCRRTRTAFLPVGRHGATTLSVSTRGEASGPARTMGTACAQCPETPWQAWGLSGGVGGARIGVLPKRTATSPWVASSSCTTSASEAKGCFRRSSSYWSRKPLESNMSVRNNTFVTLPCWS
jgi:hypothetical protein